MEMALILVSVVSFFALVAAWIVIPSSERAPESAKSPVAAQPAH